MNWSALIAVILEFFGPIIRAWLDDLFKAAEPKLGMARPAAARVAVAQVFAAARAETWRWNLRRRAVLAACEKVALDRASFLTAMLAGGERYRLTDTEAREIVARM